MKTTIKSLLNDLMPAFQLISQFQQQGQVMLPDKLAYGIARNYSKIKTFDKQLTTERNRLIEEYVKTDSKGKFLTVGKDEEKKWDFKENGEEPYMNAINEFMDKEIVWEPFKISAEQVERAQNFPIEAYVMLDAYEITTQLTIPTLKIAD